MRTEQLALDFERPLAETLDEGSCPHMAILLESVDDVPSALASFYALGVRRNGWLFHRTLPGRGEDDRAGLQAAGLDVSTLEAEQRFELCELPLTDPPESWAQPYVPLVESQLARGFDAVWWSRFPIGQDEDLYRLALLYDRYWEACWHGRQAVSMCVYIVGGLPSDVREQRIRDLRAIHDQTLLLPPDRNLVALPRSE
jgi:hypothetical protein